MCLCADIPVIPDIEELQEEQLLSKVSAPPSVAVHRVATYKQLDSDLHKHSGLYLLVGGNTELQYLCVALELALIPPCATTPIYSLYTSPCMSVIGCGLPCLLLPQDGEVDLKMLAKFISPEEDIKEVCVCVCVGGGNFVCHCHGNC